MNFFTIHTIYGLQRMAAAEATGIPINLTHMAVGDGNGNPTTPYEDQTQLVRERYRAEVNRVYQGHDEPTMFIAEMVVPADTDAFTLREVGIFDSDGGLFAVGNLPSTYKPRIEEGSISDPVIRMEFMVSNASVVTLKIDPNIAVASQRWIRENITPAFLLPGGTTGQMLRKRSNADGDTQWSDVTDVNVVVEIIEEIQFLVDEQIVIDLQYATTKGLAIYIAMDGYNGERLPRELGTNGWQPDPDEATRVILGRPYPGAKVICVQNEPLGSMDQPLAREKNLEDLVDAAVARKNLDVYNKAESDASGQPGDIKYTVRSTAPAGWLKANGAAINRVSYAALFSVIGETYGKGDGFNTFNVPDMRGEFLRGWDDSRGVDPGRQLGTAQGDQNKSHSHSGSTDSGGGHSHTYVDGRPMNPAGRAIAAGGDHQGIWENTQSRTTDRSGSHSHSISTSNSGGTESRPRNVAMLACIKF